MKSFAVVIASLAALVSSTDLFADDFTLSRLSSDQRIMSDADIPRDSVINRDAEFPRDHEPELSLLYSTAFAAPVQELNQRDEEWGTDAVLSLMAGVGYPRWTFDVETTTEEFNIDSSIVLAAAANFEFRVFRDVSVFANIEQDLGSDIRARILTFGVGYNLYYPIFNFFEPKEEKAMVFAGLAIGNLDVIKEGFPDNFDTAIGPCAGLQLSGMIERHWEFIWTVQFRYLDFKYDASPTVISAPSAVGGGSGYTLIGIGYRF